MYLAEGRQSDWIEQLGAPRPTPRTRAGQHPGMGLFGFLRRGDEDAIPKPGTPEFEAAARSAIPDSQSVSMGETGWTSTSASNTQIERPSQTIDLRGTGQREEVERVPRARHRSGAQG